MRLGISDINIGDSLVAIENFAMWPDPNSIDREITHVIDGDIYIVYSLSNTNGQIELWHMSGHKFSIDPDWAYGNLHQYFKIREE